ncbi:MAG: hypothetical protein L0216_00660 [Planctomycetales bacterium]|nr:hypothetical protein [Planctomycetales bacterium]
MNRKVVGVLVATFLALVACTLVVPAVPGPLVTDRASATGSLDLGVGDSLQVDGALMVPAYGPFATSDARPGGLFDYRERWGAWFPPAREWVWVGRVLSPGPFGHIEDGLGKRALVRQRWDVVTPVLLVELLTISALGGLLALRIRLRRAPGPPSG